MTPRTTTNIGTLAAIPLLLSLLALSAFVYVASVATPRTTARDTAEREHPVDAVAISRTGDRARLAQAVTDADAKIHALEQQVSVKGQVAVTNLVPTGTRRPAVFVECSSDGAWVMPERRRLAADAPAGDAAALVARLASTHFVVFLVRPSGFRSFAAYRAVIERHNAGTRDHVDYGFEPVDAGWKLAYPDQNRGGV